MGSFSAPESARVRTPDGLTPIRDLRPRSRVWTGHGWAVSEAGPSDLRAVLEVELADSSTVLLHPDAQLLVAAGTHYSTVPAIELRPGLRLAVAQADGPILGGDRYRAGLPFWFGALHGSGILTDDRHLRLRLSTAWLDGRAIEAAVPFLRRVGAAQQVSVKPAGDHTEVRLLLGGGFRALVSSWAARFESSVVPDAPLRAYASLTIQRRAYLNGYLAARSELLRREDGTYWGVKHNDASLRNVAELLRSAGLCGFHDGQQLLLPAWTASLAIDGWTSYPRRDELRREAAPSETVLQYIEFYDTDATRRTVRGVPRLARLLAQEGDVHTALLRRAWRSLRVRPPSPIYDTVAIKAVRVGDARPVRSLELPAESLELDGLVSAQP